MGSVVSTFLVSLGVVAATIAAVLYVALNGPDQPAMIRRPPPRARAGRRRRGAGGRRRRVPAVEPAPVTGARPGPVVPRSPGVGASAAAALPDSDAMRLRVLPAKPTTLWVRIRSGVALVVLVAVLGALLATAVGALLVGATILIRNATA
jgi:hypothetical protein